MIDTVKVRGRDRIVGWLANQIIRLASPWYRDMIAGSIEYGLRAALRDVDEGRTPPPDWRNQ